MKYSRNFLKQLEAALLKTKESPPRSDVGICGNVERFFYLYREQRHVEGLLISLFKIWPSFSGWRGYPIPYQGEAITHYLKAQRRGGLWDKATEYGRNRYELLDFLIEQVQTMIREVDDYIEEHELEYLEDKE